MSKNVLFIHHVSCMAGAERYLLSLIEALDSNTKAFFICQEPGPLSEALIAHGVVVEYMPLGAWRKLRCLTANVGTVKSIVKFCETYRIDLICSNNYRVSSYAVWPARILKIPSMTIVQDFVNRQKLWKFNTFQSNYVIGVSRSITEGISKYFKNIGHIYNGIDIPSLIRTLKSSDVLRDQFSTLQGKRIVGMVAHIIPLKGHKVFLKAMQSIAQRFDDVMFVIIGDSPNPKQLSLEDIKTFAGELNLANRVVFTGTRHDTLDLIQSFDILVHTSEREAFGRVIMEAMALKVPVVATDCGGPGEIIEEGISGFLVPVGDDKQIAQRVEMLLLDENKRKIIGLNGRKRIEEHFSIQKTVGQINSLFDKVLTKKV